MDGREPTTNEYYLARCEAENMRHAYHRSRAEMARLQRRARETGKPPLWFLQDDEDWTPVPMDATFWAMVAGGLIGLRRHLRRTGALPPGA